MYIHLVYYPFTCAYFSSFIEVSLAYTVSLRCTAQGGTQMYCEMITTTRLVTTFILSHNYFFLNGDSI